MNGNTGTISLGHYEHIYDWEVAMKQGLLDNGRPFSENTVKIYVSYLKFFLTNYKVLNRKTMRALLSAIPPEMFGKRDKYYKALICFAKYLIEEGEMEAGFLSEVSKIRPKRHLPPRKVVLDEQDLDTLLDACKNFKERAAIILCASTGLRASEVCNLKWDDLDFRRAILKVQKGKWGKSRSLGLNEFVIEALETIRTKKSDRVFNMTRHGLHKMISTIGARCRIKVYPHALRVAFVTINHKKGRPLQALQIACGHSKITTTAGYCHIKEEEVVHMMQGWA